MIDLNRPRVLTSGLLLFSDDQQPPVWHVVPERPALERLEDGRPACLLIKYRLDLSRSWPRGGGLLLLQCGLRLPMQALDEARMLIAQSGTMPEMIVPLQPDRVTCELLLWPSDTSGQSIVTATPSLVPPFTASFHVPLSMEGVTLFEHALRSGQSPATLTYRLSVNTRRPQLPATVTIDWRRVSEAFLVNPSTGVQKLIELGAIGIEVTPVGDDIAAIQGVMAGVVEEVSHIVATRMPPPAERRATATLDLSQPREEDAAISASATIGQLLEALGPEGRPESLIALMEEMPRG